MASHNILTSRETTLAKRKLRTRSTTLIVKSRSLRSLCFNSLYQQPLRTALRFNLTKFSLVRGRLDLALTGSLFDLPDFALNQITLFNSISVSEFLRNSDPTFPPHIDRKGHFLSPIIRHYLHPQDNASLFSIFFSKFPLFCYARRSLVVTFKMCESLICIDNNNSYSESE